MENPEEQDIVKEGNRTLLSRQVLEQTLTVVSPVLYPDEEAEWILSDGLDTIGMTIGDEQFLDAVESGAITFTAGCSLLAEVEIAQWMTPDGVLSQYRITRVLDVTDPWREKNEGEQTN